MLLTIICQCALFLQTCPNPLIKKKEIKVANIRGHSAKFIESKALSYILDSWVQAEVGLKSGLTLTFVGLGLGLGPNGLRVRVKVHWTLVQWTRTRTLVQWTRTHTWWTRTLAWWTRTRTLALWTRTHCWTHESGLTTTLIHLQLTLTIFACNILVRGTLTDWLQLYLHGQSHISVEERTVTVS